jgi:hypothetical protein
MEFLCLQGACAAVASSQHTQDVNLMAALDALHVLVCRVHHVTNHHTSLQRSAYVTHIIQSTMDYKFCERDGQHM